jgi:hypothetical protein
LSSQYAGGGGPVCRGERARPHAHGSHAPAHVAGEGISGGGGGGHQAEVRVEGRLRLQVQVEPSLRRQAVERRGCEERLVAVQRRGAPPRAHPAGGEAAGDMSDFAATDL